MMKLLKKYVPLLFLLLLFPVGVFAQQPQATPNSISSGLNFVDTWVARPGGLVRQTSIVSLIETVILWLLGFVGILLLVALIWGGFKYILAFGDEKKIEVAKKVILGSLTGVIIIATSFLVIQIVRNFISPAGIFGF